MNKYNVNVLAEAKEEYQRQLINILYPEIYVGIKSIYDAAHSYCIEVSDKNILKKFQQLLSNIPQWNQDKIDGEYKRIINNTDCDFIEDLITAVFVSHTKILSSIKLKKKSQPIPLNVPIGTYFIHKCYIESARNFWKKTWLLDNENSAIEIQRNQNDSELLIKESIIETVRKLLPVKYILKEYLGNDYQDDGQDEFTDSISSSTKDNLRNLVKQEIENHSHQKGDMDDVNDNFSHLEIRDSDSVGSDSEPIKRHEVNKSSQIAAEIHVDESPNEDVLNGRGSSDDKIKSQKGKEEVIQLKEQVEDVGNILAEEEVIQLDEQVEDAGDILAEEEVIQLDEQVEDVGNILAEEEIIQLDEQVKDVGNILAEEEVIQLDEQVKDVGNILAEEEVIQLDEQVENAIVEEEEVIQLDNDTTNYDNLLNNPITTKEMSSNNGDLFEPPLSPASMSETKVINLQRAATPKKDITQINTAVELDGGGIEKISITEKDNLSELDFSINESSNPVGNSKLHDSEVDEEINRSSNYSDDRANMADITSIHHSINEHLERDDESIEFSFFEDAAI